MIFNRFQIRGKLLLLVLATFLLVWCAYLGVRNSYPLSNLSPKTRWTQLLRSKHMKVDDLPDPCDHAFRAALSVIIYGMQDCIKRAIADPKFNMWLDFHQALNKCKDKEFWKLLKWTYLYNWGDVKSTLLPGPFDPPDRDCNAVTLGIGDDIAAELKLKKLRPNCRFFGADPYRKSGAVYERIGKYYETGIAAKTGEFRGLIRKDNLVYHLETVKTLSLHTFLTKVINVSIVDNLFMDIEGAEYEIFRQFLPGELLSSTSGIVICQISLEFLGPLENYNMTNEKYKKLISDTIFESPFFPVWQTAPTGDEGLFNYIIAYYVNFGHDYCVQKYIRSNVCADK